MKNAFNNLGKEYVALDIGPRHLMSFMPICHCQTTTGHLISKPHIYMPLPSSVLHLNLDVTKCILPDIDGSTLIQDGCPSPSWSILLNRKK